MYALLLGILGSLVFLCDSSRYASNDYRKRIALESARFLSPPVSRIIGGEKATIEEYPFAVSLQNNGTFFGHEVEHFCGGSIIGQKWIITSAQCALRIHIQEFHVRAGTSYYYKNGETYGVKSVVTHPMFNEINYDFDVGLIELSENIQYDNTRQPIKLPTSNSSIEDDTLVRVVGWGATRMLGPMSEDLLWNTIPKISNEECVRANGGNSLTQQMFCVLSDKVSPCIGDSGSPVILNDTLMGVASWSTSCAYEYPTTYATIAKVTNWIAETTGIA